MSLQTQTDAKQKSFFTNQRKAALVVGNQPDQSMG